MATSATNTPAVPVLPRTAPAPAPATNAVSVDPDIRGAKPPPEPFNPGLWVTVGALVLAAALVGWLLWRRRPRPQLAAAQEIILPPHVRARHALAAAMELIGQPKPFCIAVSDTLRAYLEARFHLAAPERTTEEFLVELQASQRLETRHNDSLARFLARCDLVKFARQEPAREELLDLHATALQLVNDTVPPPEPEPPLKTRSTSGGKRRRSSPRHHHHPRPARGQPPGSA